MLSFVFDFYLYIDTEQSSEEKLSAPVSALLPLASKQGSTLHRFAASSESEAVETPQKRSDEEARRSPAEIADVLRNINSMI